MGSSHNPRTTLENNRKLRAKVRKGPGFEKFGGHSGSKRLNLELEYNNSSPEELEIVRRRISRRKNAEVAISVLLLILFFCLIYYLPAFF